MMRSLMVGRVAMASRLTAVAAPVRAELKTVGLGGDGDLLGERGLAEGQHEVGRDAEADEDVLHGLRLEAAQGRRHGVGAADAHAGD